MGQEFAETSIDDVLNSLNAHRQRMVIRLEDLVDAVDRSNELQDQLDDISRHDEKEVLAYCRARANLFERMASAGDEVLYWLDRHISASKDLKARIAHLRGNR